MGRGGGEGEGCNDFACYPILIFPANLITREVGVLMEMCCRMPKIDGVKVNK